jgi:leucyl-tRNA synthetase
LYPIGWDAFGLPTENYALKTGRKPQDITRENTDTFRRQLKSLGLSFDWSREVNTTDPDYYKWTQWMFLEFFKAGLAYKNKQPINWCLTCKIGLANEEIVNGKCERCGGPTEKRDKEQWMIAITKYADRLLDDLDTVNYLEKIKTQQRNWIGKSEGAEIDFVLNVPGQEPGKHHVTVFTTRPDTILGATFLVVSPEVVQKWMDVGWQATEEVRLYVAASLKREEMDRTAEGKEKTGVDTHVVAINPANGHEMSVWVADYVLGGYGTGSIMAVPFHDQRDAEFARTFGLPIVDEPLLPFDEIIKQVGARKKTNYKLRDWVFSRQRYWGEPIPLVWCETHHWVAVPNEQLPVVLPDVESYEPTDTGESPLAAIDEWVNTICPTCGAPATRETDTMPNWAGSSWYFLRYIDPHNTHEFAAREKLQQWMPVDLYNGGMEHTVLHLLYSRFWNKVLFDRGHVPTSEPYTRRHSHGLILAEDGTKMSKSKGNVVNPDEIVRDYGADALRMYILFMGPFEEPVPWSVHGVIGVRRFLEKVDRYVQTWVPSTTTDLGIAGLLERTLKKVSDDIESFKFNTAVSTFMSFFNELEGQKMTREQIKRLLVVLGPFAPHLANEWWEKIGEAGLVEEQSWPTVDETLLPQEEIEMGVQVNGKARATIRVSPTSDEATAKSIALADEKVQKHLDGKEIVKVVYVPGRILNIVVK